MWNYDTHYVVRKISKEGKRKKENVSLFHSQFEESRRILNHDIYTLYICRVIWVDQLWSV